MSPARSAPPASNFHQLAPLYFLTVTLIAQTAGAVIFAVLYAQLSGYSGARSIDPKYICSNAGCVPLAILLLPAWGAASLLIAFLFRLSRAWQLINLVVAPLGLIYAETGLPAWPLIVPVVLGALTYLPTFWTRVPYYPTSTPMYEAIASVLPSQGSFSFIDLGCGFGALLAFLRNRFPKATFTGVEIGLLPYLISKLRFCREPRVRIQLKSFWRFSFEPYDVIYAFLAPGPMPRLWEKVQHDARPGSLFLVNSFPVPAPSTREIQVQDERECRLYIYAI